MSTSNKKNSAPATAGASQIAKANPEETRFVSTGITWDYLMNNWNALSHCPKPRLRSGVRHCYLCRRERGEESLMVHGKREMWAYPPVKLNLYKVDLSNGGKFGFYLCDECCILLKVFSQVASTELIRNRDLPIQKIKYDPWDGRPQPDDDVNKHVESKIAKKTRNID